MKYLALVSEILSMTYVVVKGYLKERDYSIDCLKPEVATEPGKVYRNHGYISIFYLLVISVQ